MKKCLLILLIIGFGISQVYSSDVLGIKSSSIITLTGSYSSKGGDLYEVGGSSQTMMELSATANYFVVDKIYAGLGIGYLSSSIGDIDYSSISIGPNVGYMFNDLSEKICPYLNVGMRIVDADDISGTSILLGAGAILPVSNHAGLVIEGMYHMDDMEIEGAASSDTGARIVVNIGIAGFLTLF